MAGRNQHYIPSLLQRAFGIRPRRKEIWHFEHGVAAQRRLIKRTASKDYFYSEPRSDGRITLDNTITMIESDLSTLLNDLRTSSPGDVIAPRKAAAVISHLAQRTAHIRTTLQEGMERLLGRTRGMLSDRDRIKMLMGFHSGLPTDRFRELMVNDLVKRREIAQCNIPIRMLERMAFLFAKENADPLLEKGMDLVNITLDELQVCLHEVARGSHNKALGELMSSGEHENILWAFDWSVESAPVNGAILPDCVAIGFDSQGKAGSHLLIGGTQLQALLLAVSPDRLLVGRKRGFVLPSDFDFNIEAACLSCSFFLAPRSDKETARLHEMIGHKSRPALAQAVDLGFDDAIRDGGYETEVETDPSDANTLGWKSTSSAVQYELSLNRCGDEQVTEQIQKAVSALVNKCATVMPLERLDGITIGSDYPGLLQSVKRGWENAPEIETVPTEVGIGIAQMVTVRRSGTVKGRIVISSIVSDALISEGVEARAWAKYVLVRQLAMVALIQIVEECLPGTLLVEVPDTGIDGWLYANVDGAPESYAASRVAGLLGGSEKIAIYLRNLLAEVIDQMMTDVSRERLAYRDHGNLEKLLNIALSATRRVLYMAADLLGYCASTGESPVSTTHVLEDVLNRAGLRDWLRVYSEDLARFYARSSRWASFKEFLAFNIHVERLLLTVGMVAREGPGGLHVEILSGTGT